LRLLLLGSLVAMSACGSSSADNASSLVSQCPDESKKGSLVVLAASSMAPVFANAEEKLLAENPCITDVAFSYGSSATLAAQIVNGSPADVFISASEKTMNTVKDADKTLSVYNFAKNAGEIMVNTDSKYDSRITDIASLTDAVNAGIKVGLCVTTAPCGALADSILGKAGISRTATADTETPSVEDLVSKIEMGELDAGIVFHSDCVSAQNQESSQCVTIPSDMNASTSYYVAALSSRAVTQQFAGFISSPSFIGILQSKFGFLTP
jgi:molybdate transport system substrate-binding protein